MHADLIKAEAKFGAVDLADGRKVVLTQQAWNDNNSDGEAAWFARGYLNTETPDDETGPTVTVEWASLGNEEPENDADWSSPSGVSHYSLGELSLA